MTWGRLEGWLGRCLEVAELHEGAESAFKHVPVQTCALLRGNTCNNNNNNISIAWFRNVLPRCREMPAAT